MPDARSVWRYFYHKLRFITDGPDQTMCKNRRIHGGAEI